MTKFSSAVFHIIYPIQISMLQNNEGGKSDPKTETSYWGRPVKYRNL